MRGILLLNGRPYSGEIDADNALVYCCDGAYRWATGKVKIDKNIGDFDSLDVTPYPPPEEIYPSEKNFTDGEIALKALLNAGVSEVEIYGAFGGRTDHFLGNLHLLVMAHSCGIKCKALSEKEEIFIASGLCKLNGLYGKTVSVLPFGGDLHIIKSEGLKYCYPPVISYGECRGVSNVVTDDVACIRFSKKSRALIIINKGTV